MIKLCIPGRGDLQIENIVFDYNGTLAADGVMKEGTKEFLLRIKDQLNVYIVTADTYGTVGKEVEGLGVTVKTFPNDYAGQCKKEIVEEIGGENTLCVGNGFNDMEMFKVSALSIAIIGEEGCYGKLLSLADIVVREIEDVFLLLLQPNRMKATLRY